MNPTDLISCCRYKHPYIQGVYELAELITERFRFFPYHNPMIYHLSWSGYKFRRACRLVHTYSQEVIQNKQKDKLAENGVNMDDIHWLKHCAIILEVETICDVCTHHIFKPSTKVRPWWTYIQVFWKFNYNRRMENSVWLYTYIFVYFWEKGQYQFIHSTHILSFFVCLQKKPDSRYLDFLDILIDARVRITDV